MHPYVVNLIIVMVGGIIVAIISDLIVKKKRNGNIDTNKISDSERDLIDKKREHNDEYQRMLNQTLSSGFG